MSNIGRIKEKEWEEYEYDIQINISSGGKMLKLKSAQIQSLMIEKNFDDPNQNLPIVILSISKQESTKIEINNKTDIIISIDKFIATKDKEGKIKKKKKKKNVLRDTFCAIVPDVTPTDDSLKKVSQKEEKVKKDEVTQYDLTSQDTYTLSRKKDLSASKHIFNGILSNVSMTQAIATLLSQAQISKVLMSSLDHVETIPELLLMPLGLIAQLKYLKNYYGWHKEDTLIFMDFDVMYLLRMNGKCTAWRSGETKKISFYVNSISKGDNVCGGMVTKGNSLYINVGSDNYVDEDKTGVAEQTVGSNVMMVNEDEASVSSISGTTTNTLTSSGTTSIKSTTGHNKYLSNWVKCRSKEQSGIMNLTCNNIDFSVLTPNKEYSMVSQKTKIAKEIKGTYRLSKMTTSFAKDGNSFTAKTNVTLKKSIG